ELCSLAVNRSLHSLVVRADARNLPLDPCSAHLVVCHPPYFNLYKYSSIYSFELAWLGWNPVHIRKAEIREGFKLGKPERVGDYVDDMVHVLNEQYRVLVDEGVCALMVGDAEIHGNRIPTTSFLLQAAERVGLAVERIIVRKPRRTEAAYKTALRRKTS